MTQASPPSSILRTWRTCRRIPGGRQLFHLLLRRKVPYTGTIHPRVEEVAPGYAKVRMADRYAVRNHLRSIHAIALANLGELASGLAMMAALPDGARGIPIEIRLEFLKKARGTIAAVGSCRPPAAGIAHDHPVEAILTDESGDKVARLSARWRVGPAS